MEATSLSLINDVKPFHHKTKLQPEANRRDHATWRRNGETALLLDSLRLQLRRIPPLRITASQCRVAGPGLFLDIPLPLYACPATTSDQTQRHRTGKIRAHPGPQGR